MDARGIVSFLQLPQYSFFGDYQVMFDLRANFTIKVTGKEDTLNFVAKSERTFFLCVDQEILTELLEKFPKAKFICYKRALQRRKVFMGHYEKLEAYLKMKEQQS